MSKTVQVLKGQNLLDLSIQETGTIENVIKIAEANNMSVTDDIVSGFSIIIPDNVEINNKVKNYFESRKIKPATDVLAEMVNTGEGIEFWAIETEFIVS